MTTFEHILRGGTYYRVCDPSWADCADTSFSKRYGGRWNAAGAFGALYLNASIAVAIANARRALRLQFGDAVSFDDLQDHARPELARFTIEDYEFVNALTNDGLNAAGLDTKFPLDCDHGRCQLIGLNAHAAGEGGIAARSAVLENGEELAIFDTHLHLQRLTAREPFRAWYPGVG